MCEYCDFDYFEEDARHGIAGIPDTLYSPMWSDGFGSDGRLIVKGTQRLWGISVCDGSDEGFHESQVVIECCPKCGRELD